MKDVADLVEYMSGTWAVTAESGPGWFMALNILKDKKVISGTEGYNVARGIKWGMFKVTSGEQPALVLTYSPNTILTYDKHPIVDKLYRVHKNRLLGVFYYRNKYIGEFRMERIEDEFNGKKLSQPRSEPEVLFV